jgi:hypothetical protein
MERVEAREVHLTSGLVFPHLDDAVPPSGDLLVVLKTREGCDEGITSGLGSLDHSEKLLGESGADLSILLQEPAQCVIS